MNSTSSSHYLNNYPAVVSFDENDSDYEYNKKEFYSSSGLYAATNDNASSKNNVSTTTTKQLLLLDENKLDVLVNRDAIATATAAAAENATTTTTTTASFTTDANNISIDMSDIVDEYDEDDLNLMREGLSLVMDETEVIMADSYNSNNENNSNSVSPTTDYDNFDDRINNMFDITDKYRAATTATTTTTIGRYPSLLAQVTFDEDEDEDSSSCPPHSHQQVERYDENDLNLMREALIVIDDNDDEDEGTMMDSSNNNIISPTDYNNFLNGHTNNNSSASKAGDKYKATTTAKTTPLFGGGYSTLLAHVTFDEDDNNNALPRSHAQHQIKPSPWLNGQLASYCDAFPRSSRGRTSSHKSTKNNNDKRRTTTNNVANEATRHQHWSDQEDKLLKIEVKKQKFQGGNINWEVISKSFGGTRAPIQCKNRLNNYLQLGKVYGDWDQYEDVCILDMKRKGFMWADIADRLQRRTGNHIRERFVNYLDPNIKKTPWTKEEDTILLANQRTLGNKWADIQKLLPGPGIRPQNSIKNRFNNRVQANKRRLARSQKQQNVFRLN